MTTEYLKLTEVAERYKVSPRTIQRLIKNEDFPKGEQFSPQVKLWSSESIEEWFTDKNKEVRKDLLTE
jgi:predicted DNA-binding transcriptional regulator AlpA